MFTKACYIRKNTNEIREVLKELGYKNYGNPFQETDNTYIYTTIDGYYVPYRVRDIDDSWCDCGSNEKLFYAIAALRDDTDFGQWFVSRGWNDGFGNVSDHWVLCTQQTLARVGEINNSPNSYSWQKASVEELVEKFG